MDNKTTLHPSTESEIENARVGYQATISIFTSLLSVIWSIFNTMLLANSIVVAGLVLALTNQPVNANFRNLLSIVGLILCLVWFLIAKRHRDYLAYYMMSARELEEQYLGQTVKTLSRGGSFAKGKEVSLLIDKTEGLRRMSFWSRLVKGELASYIIIVVFATIYIGILFF